jgi:hypothetical protein
VIADVLLDEAVPVVTADDGVGQIHVLDDGLQFSPILFGNFPAEDHGDLVRLTDGPIGIQQPLAHLVEPGSAAEDEVVAKFDLREEQPMLAARVLAFPFGEERRKRSQPLLAAGQHIASRQGIGQFL